MKRLFRKLSWLLVIGGVIACLLAVPGLVQAQTIKEYSLRHVRPEGITRGPEGNLWFTEFQANKIGRITPEGNVTEYSILTPESHPMGITRGPDGNLWFTESGAIANKIGRITPGGTITEYSIRTPESYPWGITSGPDGNLWFTEYRADKIGRITPEGTITEYSIRTAKSEPRGITSGPDGSIWLTETEGNKIGRMAAGIIKVCNVFVPNMFSNTITIPANVAWYTPQCLKFMQD